MDRRRAQACSATDSPLFARRIAASIGDVRTERWFRGPSNQRHPYHRKSTSKLEDRKRQRMAEKSSLRGEAKMHPPQASEKRREIDPLEVKRVCNIKQGGFEPEIRFAVLPSAQSETPVPPKSHFESGFLVHRNSRNFGRHHGPRGDHVRGGGERLEMAKRRLALPQLVDDGLDPGRGRIPAPDWVLA